MQTQSDFLNNVTGGEVFEFLNHQYYRLFDDDIGVAGQEIKDIQHQKVGLFEDLEEFLAKKPNTTSLTDEIIDFEKNQKLSLRLLKLKSALESIGPATVSIERCFSIVGNFVRRCRNRVSSEFLEALIILCDFYLFKIR